MAQKKDKYPQKRQQLIERTALALGITEQAATELLMIGRNQAMRINTLKGEAERVLAELRSEGVVLRPVEWSKGNYYIDEGITIVRDHTLSDNGVVYIQNAASWLPVLALDPQPGDDILDVCAAPGGKTSHIAQLTQNRASITANDNSRPRLLRLQRNLERLGVQNAAFTLHDATRIAKVLEGRQFDRILLDAPCSGEGMMTLDSRKDFESWSVAHIKRLQQLQKKIITQAWQALKPGGTLVYSTCTIAPEENEAVVDYLLRHNDDVRVVDLAPFAKHLEGAVPAVKEWNGKSYRDELSGALRLKPTRDVEAFFVVKLTKTFEA